MAELEGQRAGKSANAALILAAITEEIAEKFGGLFGGDSLLQLHLVVELGVVEHGED